MRRLASTVSVGVAILSVACLASAADPQPFASGFRVELEQRGLLYGCSLRIATGDSGREATESVHCWSDDGTDQDARSELKAEEVEELRGLLRGADLFHGQFWGGFSGGIVSELLSLQVTDADKVATIICSENETFYAGARNKLIKWLGQRLKRAKKNAGGGGPTSG